VSSPNQRSTMFSHEPPCAPSSTNRYTVSQGGTCSHRGARPRPTPTPSSAEGTHRPRRRQGPWRPVGGDAKSGSELLVEVVGCCLTAFVIAGKGLVGAPATASRRGQPGSSRASSWTSCLSTVRRLAEVRLYVDR
jgi:hypothetical protein